MIAPIGAITGALQGTALTGVAGSGTGPSAAASAPLTVTPEAPGASVPAAEAAGGPAATGSGTGEGGFGEALTSAISSLEQGQLKASGAAQSLATGTASSPEGAIVTIQEAQLEMQLAAQIRTKATDAVEQLFQTQV